MELVSSVCRSSEIGHDCLQEHHNWSRLCVGVSRIDQECAEVVRLAKSAYGSSFLQVTSSNKGTAKSIIYGRTNNKKSPENPV